jgi:predicted NAD/FAD-dependent oxidoreductase
VVGHRWRYSIPVSPSSEGSVAVSDTPPIVVAGEAFAGARVEGAFLSGVSAASRLLDRLA